MAATLKGRRLGDILVELGAVDAGDAEAAVAHAKGRRIPLGQAMVELGLCAEELVLRALAAQLGSAFVDLGAATPDPDALARLPAETAADARVLPLRLVHNARGRDTLVVAVAHPRNPALDELEFVTGCRVAPVLVEEDALDAALVRHYRLVPAAQGGVFLGAGPGINHVVDGYFDFR